jgi:hypothetical protein
LWLGFVEQTKFLHRIIGHFPAISLILPLTLCHLPYASSFMLDFMVSPPFGSFFGDPGYGFYNDRLLAVAL